MTRSMLRILPACLLLLGIGASAGVRTGRARIVHDPALKSLDLGPADILVVPFTDVGWIPILSEVGAIVAETGGQLSHTSIIAREYGIPCVTGIPGAAELIRTGDRVTVDGWLGIVTIEARLPFERKMDYIESKGVAD